MRYDFDTVIDRKETLSVKWKVAENELPMWVADMDFQTAPEIREALRRVLDHGIFGYSVLPDEWYDAIAGWWKARHGLDIGRDELFFCSGVVPALTSCIRRLTVPGENVLVQTPVYNMFLNGIQDNGRSIAENRLIYDKDTASYSVDWADLEQKLSDPQTSLMILCNPHNPIGKIWDRETLARIGDLCAAYHVLVLSDEIHCDLTEPGAHYVPFASVSETCRKNSITCIAPTKTFNLAGIHTAAVFVSDPDLRHKVSHAMRLEGVTQSNAFAATAAIAAFTEGGPWLDELNEYLSVSRKRVGEYIEAEIPQIRLVPSEATYLLWLDCTNLAVGREQTAGFIRRETGLFLADGSVYGEAGKGFLRMNIACPHSTLEEGLRRLKAGIEAYAATPAKGI